MTVVTNTSPITNLAAIGKLRVLEDLYGEISISLGETDSARSLGHPFRTTTLLPAVVAQG